MRNSDKALWGSGCSGSEKTKMGGLLLSGWAAFLKWHEGEGKSGRSLPENLASRSAPPLVEFLLQES